MAEHSRGKEARCAHLGFFHLLLRRCPWWDAADRSVCRTCDLRPECARLAASDAELARLAA